VESILGALGTQEIPRMRIGSAPDHPVKDGAKYGLSQLRKSQLAPLDEVLDKAADAVEVIIEKGISEAMNRYNRKKPDEPDEKEPAK
jgi:PTH1 family peptidyl-tRNA hydrolase